MKVGMKIEKEEEVMSRKEDKLRENMGDKEEEGGG